MLPGTRVGTGCHGSSKAHPLRVLFPACATGIRFRVAGHRLPGWPTALGNGGDVALEFDRAPVEAQEVTRPHAVRRAHSRAVDVDLAAVHGLRGQ